MMYNYLLTKGILVKFVQVKMSYISHILESLIRLLQSTKLFNRVWGLQIIGECSFPRPSDHLIDLITNKICLAFISS